MQNVRDRYFRWLCGLVGLQDRRGLSYFTLARILHSMTYSWTIRNDGDRSTDGLQLRFIFAADNCPSLHPSLEELAGPCTIFEMLVAMAMRIDDWLYGGEDKRTGTQKWFFEMLHNLNLDIWNDGACARGEGYRDDIENKVDIFVRRRYVRNGDGGLFPLRCPQKDQREVEIWYQLQSYLKENYRLIGEDDDDFESQERSDL